jgi:hypothetical protein
VRMQATAGAGLYSMSTGPHLNRPTGPCACQLVEMALRQLAVVDHFDDVVADLADNVTACHSRSRPSVSRAGDILHASM